MALVGRGLAFASFSLDADGALITDFPADVRDWEWTLGFDFSGLGLRVSIGDSFALDLSFSSQDVLVNVSVRGSALDGGLCLPRERERSKSFFIFARV